eukprot:TRINITY_DN11388_c0_g1_i5.p1 TRINITY_DN11388_c0_g1~~TRINITY_DN11388_c0_g1_i5.p1  ORF type:complete len:462 (-),score=77.50 TRINITY_DN11388_c0_g1_i5:267-1652(-)
MLVGMDKEYILHRFGNMPFSIVKNEEILSLSFHLLFWVMFILFVKSSGINAEYGRKKFRESRGKMMCFFVSLHVLLVLSTSVKIGYLACLTYPDGRVADWGVDTKYGVDMGLQKVNTESNQFKLVLQPEMIVDTRCSKVGVAETTRQLIENGAVAILGADCSEVAQEASQITTSYRVPLISAGSNAKVLGNSSVYPFFVRLMVDSDGYESTLVAIISSYSLQSVGIISTTDPFGTDGGDAYENTLKSLHIPLTIRVRFDRGSSDDVVEMEMMKLRQYNTTTFLISGPVPETASVFRVAYKLNLSGEPYYFVSNEALGAESVGTDAVKAAYGHFTLQPDSYPSSQYDSFLEDFLALYGHQPDPYAMFGFDSVMVLADALKRSKDQGIDLMASLRKTDMYGASGKIAFRSGTNTRQWVRLVYLNLQGYNTTHKRDYAVVGHFDDMVNLYVNTPIRPKCLRYGN